MTKKVKVIALAVVAALMCALFITGYIMKHQEKQEATPTEPVAASGVVAVTPLVDAPPESWEDESETAYHHFTTRAQLGEDAESIGVLTIEKIGVSVQVYDADESNVMAAMKKGAAHYRTTSYWDGNVGFSAHIGNASYSYFERLHELKVGDTIEYETALGLRRYAVTEIVTIDETDWSRLERTEDNRLTLTTCIAGQETKRLCVVAVEV